MIDIDNGKYRGRALEWGLGLTGTGKEQIGILFEFLDRPETQMVWYGFFTDAALETTVKALRACGWQGDDPSELNDNGGGLDANEVTLVVEHETDQQGAWRPKIRWVNRAGGFGMKNQLAGSDAKAFGAGLRGKILALDPGRKPQAQAAPPKRSSDNVPF